MVMFVVCLALVGDRLWPSTRLPPDVPCCVDVPMLTVHINKCLIITDAPSDGYIQEYLYNFIFSNK